MQQCEWTAEQSTSTVPSEGTRPRESSVPQSSFEAAVGMSRQWEARQAGREVAETAIRQLSRPPDFFLLFSTIHYEKYGGFEEFLKGVWEVLPEGTPLVGGTVAGFMNSYGCYTRGSTALAVSYPNMDVAVGFGNNTKRNPKSAAKTCIKMINDKFKTSSYKNKFIIDIISGGLVPQILGMGRKKVIRGISSKLAINLSRLSLTLFQKGVGREEEVLEELSKTFDDYFILHCSSMDDGKAVSNYQFLDHTIGTNMLVSLAISIDLDMVISSNHNLQEMKTFTVTKLSKDGRVIHEINNKPAAEEFLRLLQWPEDYYDERLFKRTFFYPLGYKEDNNWVPEIVGIVPGDSMTVLHRIKNPKMAILSASGKNLMDALKNSIRGITPNNTLMAIISSCDGRLEAMGDQIFKEREEILHHFGDLPFIAVFCGGEGIKKPKEKMRYGNVTFNIFSVLKDKSYPTNALV